MSDKNNQNTEMNEIKNDLHKAAEGYAKAKQEVPQLGWGGIVGQKDMIRGLGDAFKLPLTMATSTYSIVKGAFNSKPERRPLPTDSTEPKERFLVAMETYGLNDKDIDERIKSSCLVFYLCFLGLFIDLGLYFYITWSYHTMFSFSLFPVLSLAFWLISQMFKYGLVNFQMRNKALFPAKKYLDNNANWFPPISGKGKLATFMMIGLIGLSMAAPAFAATSSTSVADDCNVNESSSISVENVLSVPCSKDLWLQSLARLFPGVGPLDQVNTGVTQTYGVGFVNALAAFVAIITAVAVGSLSYQSCIAVINTAVDGDTLGQKWHKVWAPVRICYGFGMLAPITKGGVCMAQVFVIYISLWSGNWGSMVYRAYLDGLQNPQVNPNYTLPDTGATFSQLVKLNICWAYENDVHKKAETQWPDWGGSAGKHSLLTQFTQNVYAEGYGDTSSTPKISVPTSLGQIYQVWDFGPCGRFVAPMLEKLTVSSATNSLVSLVSLEGIFSKHIGQLESFYQKRVDLIDTLNNTIHNSVTPVIDSLYKNYTSDEILRGVDNTEQTINESVDSNGALMSAYRQYNSSLIEDEKNVITSLNSADEVKKAFNDTVRDNGWMVAGPYYMTMTRMSSAISDMVGKEPSASSTAGAADNISSDITEKLGASGKGYMDRVNKFIHSLSVEANPVNVDNAITGAKNDSATGGVGTQEGFMSYGGFSPSAIVEVYYKDGVEAAFKYASNGITYAIADHISEMISVTPGEGSAMQQMINFGHFVLDIAWAIFIFAIALKVAGKLMGIIGMISNGAKGLFDVATSWLGVGEADAPVTVAGMAVSTLLAKSSGWVAGKVFTLAMLFFFVGVVYAYVFPMMPYINFLFFEQGSLMLVGECMIAAPILAYLHIRGEGEQLVDQVQKTGYMILFNLFLRIPLGIFGLIISVAIFEIGVWLNATLFKIAFNSAIADNAAGVIGCIMYLLLIMYIEWQLAIKSFSMISTMPQKIARWFGAASEDHGEASGMREFLGFAAGQTIKNNLDGFMSNRITGAMSRKDDDKGKSGKTTTGTGKGGGKTGGGKMGGRK